MSTPRIVPERIHQTEAVERDVLFSESPPLEAESMAETEACKKETGGDIAHRKLKFLARKSFGIRRVLIAALGILCLLAAARAQTISSSDEIPIERCDRLPVVKVRAADADMHFLLDTGATTMLNLKSFAGGAKGQIKISSWAGTADTSAREVALSSLALGTHTLHDLKLPAIDLSPIGKACGGPIDGILGVDLLDRMNVTIDLKRRVASLGGEPTDAKALYQVMETAMGHCTSAFEQGKGEELEQCFDPEIVLYCPKGEFRGRNEVMRYMRDEYFKFSPNLHYATKLHDVQAFGDALWYSYDFEMITPKRTESGHGMAMCRKNQGRWMILNMHNSLRGEHEQQASLPKQ